MSFFSFFLLELKRIFQAKTTWLVIALTVCTPLAGYSWYTPAAVGTKASALIANPALAGTLGGAMIFAVLTLYEIDRVHKSKTAALTDTIVSPLILNGARVLSLAAPAAVSTLFAILVYLPYTMLKMGSLFLPGLYVTSFLLLMLPGLLFGTLTAAALYQMTRRMDLSFVLFAVFSFFSLSHWVSDDYILRWINPMIPIYSDGFSNTRVLRMAAYNRLVWLALLTGCYLFSTLCTRRYGKGIFGSFRRNVPKITLPLLTIALIGAGCYAYMDQPYIDHSPIEWVEIKDRSNEKMLMESSNVDLILDTKRGTVEGKAVYQIANGNTEPQECWFTINPGYEIESVDVNGAAIPFTDLNNDTNNEKEIKIMLPPYSSPVLTIIYGGFPQEDSRNKEFLWGSEVDDRYVYLQGTAFSPSLSMSKKTPDIPKTAAVTLPGNMTLIPLGEEPSRISENPDGTKTWFISDSFISLYGGDYVKEELYAAGMSVAFFYSRRNESSMREAKAKQTMEEAMEYCAAQYGPLPFCQEKPLKMIQTTAFMQGGGAYPNFTIIGESMFNDDHLNDSGSQEGATSSEVLAHETAHHWWGLSASTYDEGPWSSEGLAVYTTYRMMKEKYGEEYGQKHYVDKWQAGVDALNRSFYRRHPEYLDILPEKYAAEIYAAEWTTQRYQLMPLMIVKASQRMGGEDKLDSALKELYQMGGDVKPRLTYDDFLQVCGLTKEAVSLDESLWL